MSPTNHLSRSQEQGWVLQEDSVENTVSHGVISSTAQETDRFLRILLQQKHASLGWKGQRWDEMEEE